MKEIWRKLLSGLAARRIAELEAEATNLRQMFGDSIVPKHKRTRKHSKRKREAHECQGTQTHLRADESVLGPPQKGR